MTDWVKTSKGEGMKRFMVVRAHEKYMGSFYETIEEAEKAALEESNGDPGGDFHVMEIICAVSRPPHPNAVLTRFVPLSVEEALERNLNITKKGRQEEKARNFGKAYGMSPEKITASLMRPTVHILKEGRPVCEFTSMVPKDWPPGHAFVPPGVEPSLVLDQCSKCFQDVPPTRTLFLNTAHELPPIKKSELRKQNKKLREAKAAGKRWCKICLSGPCGLWEFAEKGGDFCRRHK